MERGRLPGTSRPSYEGPVPASTVLPATVGGFYNPLDTRPDTWHNTFMKKSDLVNEIDTLRRQLDVHRLYANLHRRAETPAVRVSFSEDRTTFTYTWMGYDRPDEGVVEIVARIDGEVSHVSVFSVPAFEALIRDAATAARLHGEELLCRGRSAAVDARTVEVRHPS